MIDITEEVMNSKFLTANSRMIYIHYITNGSMIIRHQHVMRFLINLSKEAPAARALCITHLNDSSLYISSEDDILLRNRATDSFCQEKPQAGHFSRKLILWRRQDRP